MNSAQLPLIVLLLLATVRPLLAARSGFNPSTALAAHAVTWNVPGPTSAQSMPLGNGDIGLNVWVQPDGTLDFYIGKTDAWNQEVRADDGLMKLGEVQIAAAPSVVGSGVPFAQSLKLDESAIDVSEGCPSHALTYHIWVDANHPVIRVEARSDQPASFKVTLIDWRAAQHDGNEHILNDQPDAIAWFHRNPSGVDPHVANLTTGGLIKGDSLTSNGPTELDSSSPTTSQLISVYPYTATTISSDGWFSQLKDQMTQVESVDLQQAWRNHLQWWDAFWHRSWLVVHGDQDAEDVTQGYLLQRFVTACAGRGAYPVKFNGSLFVVDNPALPQDDGKPPRAVTADDRDWGGQYWFQNTRAMFWPRLMAGDFDIMQPLFKMYQGEMAGNAPLVRRYYHHDGSYFAETAPFWGGLQDVGPNAPANYTAHYFTPVLELSMMMLDYYDYTGDNAFARETLIPMASAGLTFFDHHFPRDSQGKLLLDPDNSIETFWKVRNPAPDIAGLHAVLARMLALPAVWVDVPTRKSWQRLQNELPDLPTGIHNNTKVLIAYDYTDDKTVRQMNGENPELYAVYPFRLYGLGKPDLQLAIDTFNARRCREKGCWVQDPIQAAMLGLTDVAEDYVHYNLTRSDPRLKFPAFWVKGNDYAPDEDNGGNGENGLQEMLMQVDGRKIMLLPAWPKNWDAEFKLHAPFRTTIQGSVVQGKLANLVVTPASRRADVIDMSDAPASDK